VARGLTHTAVAWLQERKKFVNGHACLRDNATQEAAFDVAGVMRHGYQARAVRMFEVVVRAARVVVEKTGSF